MSTGHPDTPPRLVADIGGTNARFALVPVGSNTPRPLVTLATRRFDGLEPLIQAALADLDGPRPREALLAIASPTGSDRIHLINAGWSFSIADARAALHLDRLEVVNDWVAQGWAIPALTGEDLACIQSGTSSPDAPRLALGPGTGLGSSLVVPTPAGWQIFPTEGGHMSFGPGNRREAEVVLAIQARFGHCSAERMASGIGLEAIHDALLAIDGKPSAKRDAQAIGAAAAAGDPVCGEAVTILLQAIASAAGDLALATGARGGVYIGGGLIPALGSAFEPERFRQRFTAKGRFEGYLARVSVYQIRHASPALLGLARYLEARA